MNNNRNNGVLRQPTSAEIAEFERRLATNPRWQRMEFLHAKSDSVGLTPEEEEELSRFGQPKFREGDVIQEFMRDLDSAKAKEPGREPE